LGKQKKIKSYSGRAALPRRPTGLFDFQKSHHSIAVLEHFHFRPRRDDFQRVAFRVAENKSSAGREQLRQIFIVKQLLRE
jgi:hypothetical protein